MFGPNVVDKYAVSVTKNLVLEWKFRQILVRLEAYLSATFGPNFSDFSHFCLRCAYIVREHNHLEKNIIFGRPFDSCLPNVSHQKAFHKPYFFNLASCVTVSYAWAQICETYFASFVLISFWLVCLVKKLNNPYLHSKCIVSSSLFFGWVHNNLHHQSCN